MGEGMGDKKKKWGGVSIRSNMNLEGLKTLLIYIKKLVNT